jgi:hypothetical protein
VAIAISVTLIVVGCKKECVGGDLPIWERSQYKPGGGNAFICFCVFGNFSQPHVTSRVKYRTNGLPASCKIISYRRDKAPEQFSALLDENSFLARRWKQSHSDNWSKIQKSQELVVIQGEVGDPPNLNYMRDTIGLVTSLIDAGGVVVIDPQQFRWWEPDDWRSTMFRESGPVPQQQVDIVKSEDELSPGAWWLHTRGLRKFGRPDISVHNVTKEYEEPVLKMINRFIDMEVLGGIVAEGQPIKMAGLPGGMTCHHAGNVDDADFNNAHLEIVWPTK